MKIINPFLLPWAVLVISMMLVSPLLFSLLPSNSPNQPPELVIEESQFVGDNVTGKIHEIVFVIDNPSGVEKKYLSAIPNCTPKGCVSCLHNEIGTIPIPPGQKWEFAVQYCLGKTGPFEFTLPIFVDDNGIRKIDLIVKGNAIAPK